VLPFCYEFGGVTYAAVAVKDSKGFAVVPNDTSARKSKINAVIIASFAATGCVYAKIQMGAISNTNPISTVVKVMNSSILLSEYNCIFS
jgi:hypothetical protein